MNILIAGGTGLIGQAFIEAQDKFNHQITVVSRNKKRARQIFKNSAHIISWDELLNSKLDHSDIIINLCGENIANCRWSKSVKKRLIDSRIQPTQKLLNYCKKYSQNHQIHLLNASGIGIYGLQSTTDEQLPIFNENSQIQEKPYSFLQELSQQWEKVSHINTPNLYITHCRFAPIITNRGGLLKKLLPSFKWNLGGRIGTGLQPFSWIHINDAIAALQFIIQEKITGPINIASPEIINQNEFAQHLGLALDKPSHFFMPTWLIQMIFGQMGHECLLHGQKVEPKRLIENNFEFLFPSIRTALRSQC